MTRPGRALRWVDPVVPSPEPAARAAEILATLPPPEHLEKRKRSLQLTIEEVEVEEMLGPFAASMMVRMRYSLREMIGSRSRSYGK